MPPPFAARTGPARGVLAGAARRLAGVLLTGLLLIGPAAAQDPAEPQLDPLTGKPVAKKKPVPVNMVVFVGQANTAREGRITPVRVVMDNLQGAVAGRLELRDFRGHRSVMSVELPRGAHKEYTLFAVLASDSDHRQRASAELLLTERGRLLAREVLIPIYAAETTRVVVSSTGDAGGLQFLQEDRRAEFLTEERRYRVTHQSPPDLPHQWPGYEPATAVALNGRAWQALDDEQKRALRIWVEQGGSAVLCGEMPREWDDPEGRALAGVLPRELGGARRLGCVAPWAGLPWEAAAGSLLTTSGPLQPGSTALFREGGRPLIVMRRALRGHVLWIGFDPFRAAFREWEGSARFWRQALEELRRTAAAVPPGTPLESVEEARAAVSALPRLPAPPLAAIIGFGVVYAFIFGPVNIWMLRRMRRTVRAWLFVPALAGVMTVVVLVVGQTWGSARTVLNSVSVLHGAAGARTAAEVSLVGLFSPTNRSFDLTLEDPAPRLEEVTGLDPAEVLGGLPVWPDRQEDGWIRWDQIALQLYSVRLLKESRPRDLGGAVEARLAALPGGTLQGSVRNDTNLSLRRAYLHRRGRYCWLGDLPVGTLRRVSAGEWRDILPRAGGEAAAPAVEQKENRDFRLALERLWHDAPTLLPAETARGAAYLVAECAGYRGGLEVAQLPYSNRAGLLVLRID